MTKLWKLSLIFVCKPNHYTVGTSVEHDSANPNLYTRGDLIPGIRVRLVKNASNYCMQMLETD